jgi:Flp pilus assembly protein TadD
LEASSTKYRVLNSSLSHVILICILALIVYSNSFNVPFAFDDIPYIVENPRIETLSNIPTLFTNIEGPIGSRPFTLTTFAINYFLGKLNTFGYHVFNLILHIINGLLLYSLIIMTARLLNYTEENVRPVALFSSLIFIVHPIQTECVTYIVGRSTPLITLFYLLGIVLFIKVTTRKKGKALYITGLFLVSLLGMASRENFVTFPFMLILFDFFFVSKYRVKEVIKHYKIHASVFLPLIYFFYLTLNYHYELQIFEATRATPIEYLMTQFNVHWTYLRLFVLPVNQNFDYDYSVARTLFEFPTIISFIGYMGLWAMAIYLYKKRPVISFCILWFLITLSPVSSIIPLGKMIFEHRLYLPSVGVFVAIVSVLFSLFMKLNDGKSRIASLSLILILLVFSYATYARNIVWQSKISLLEDVAMKSPNLPRSHNNLGIAYQEAGLTDMAIERYQMAVKLNPNMKEQHINLGNAYKSLGQFDKAMEQYQIAIKLDPDDPEPYNNLGTAYKAQGQLDKAMEQYQIAIKLDPDNPKPYNNLGTAYKLQGQLDKAVEQYQIAIKLDPDNPKPYNNLGNVYMVQGQLYRAIEQHEIAIKLNPDDPDPYINLGTAYKLQGQLDKAIEQYKFALRLRPDIAETHFNLGVIYLEKGLMEEAFEEIQMGLRINPNDRQAQLLLDYISQQK